MAKKRIFVLGAGLAGLSAAWHLQRKGIDCQVLEKESETGGLCRSKNVSGFTFDIDGHLLHFKHKYAFGLIKSLLGENLMKHKRNAWVYAYGRFIRYPFQANLYGLPKPVALDCLLGFIKAYNNGYKKTHNGHSFDDWINASFGKGIARHFMVPYNTKFWTIPPEEITCGWLDGHIPVPSLDQVIEGAIEDNERQFGYNTDFWYPKRGGILSLPLSLASRIKNIRISSKVTMIDLEKREIETSPGIKEKFDSIISTIPLPELPLIVKKIPGRISGLFTRLKWNSVFNLNLGINKKDVGGRHWVYFAQKDISFFRAGFAHNFSEFVAPAGKGSLYTEVAYSKDKPIDRHKIVPRIKDDLRKFGILSSNDMICTEDINDIKYGYPIYDAYYDKARSGILEYLYHKDVISCGRYGSWRYMSMEESLLDGRRAAIQLK
jgi:UDP-galactopyranose mutase